MANSSNQIVDMTGKWFAKAPALPVNIRHVLVTITPWVALIFGILGVLGALAGLGILTAFAPFAPFGGVSGVASYGTGFIAALFWLVSSALMLAAFPGTKARKLSGWNLLFWSELVNVVGQLLALNILGAVIGGFIGFYLLFQIKHYYK